MQINRDFTLSPVFAPFFNGKLSNSLGINKLESFSGERGTLFWRFLFSNLFIIRHLKFQKNIFWTVFDPILTRLAESKVLSANYLGHYSRS